MQDPAENRPVHLRCAHAGNVNVAFHQNAIPSLRELTIENRAGRELRDVVVRLSGEPAFLVPQTWRLDSLADGESRTLPTAGVRLDPGFLRRITESLIATFTLTATVGDAELSRDTLDVRLLPPSHWTGLGAAPELLAAFVRPNDAAIDALLRKAAAKLAEAGRSTEIDGYASGQKARIWEMAEAIWAAAASLNLTYVYPPASFEQAGQKVRGPSEIFDSRVGTCLDTALLLAAAFEQANLQPLVVILQGHAFVGLWLEPQTGAEPVLPDAQSLRKRRDLQDVIFIESTLLTSDPPTPFLEAVGAGAAHLEEGVAAAFALAVDVAAARTLGIRPLELGDRNGPGGGTLLPEVPRELPLGEAPAFLENPLPEAADAKAADRLETWKRRLLDLTLRNRLLNFGKGPGSLSLFCPDPASLEDALASGKKFKLRPRPETPPAVSPPRPTLVASSPEVVVDPFRLALERGELLADAPADDLDARLTALFRKMRTALEEGGTNLLYLAFGFLRWRQPTGSTECRAPILLIPVTLQRRSVLDGFRLALHEDEPRINPTLLEMLRQDFRMELPELEKALPTDGSGLDVQKVWHIFRHRIRDLRGWEVTEEVALSTFSFTKHLMWRDLQEQSAKLKENPVVRHLLDTPKVSFDDGVPFPEPAALDQVFAPKNVFAPLSADSSQLAAVFAAAAGKNFVLFGPPGTGKSQTIANTIAQCLAEGKTVLFVSQKTAALEVVQRRLNDIGLGDHVLELHSAKAQKSLVLARLKKAWESRANPPDRDWIRATGDLENLRLGLNGFVAALHQEHPNGDTAYRAFGRLVARRDLHLDLSFTPPSGQGSEVAFSVEELGRDLAAAVKVAGNLADHPLREMGARDWSPAWVREVRDGIDETSVALVELERVQSVAADLLGLEINPAGYAEGEALAGLCDGLSRPEADLAARLPADSEAALTRERAELRRLQARETTLLSLLKGTYRPSVLETDLDDLTHRWATVERSFFLVRAWQRHRVRKTLAAHAEGRLPADLGEDLAILSERRLLQRKASDLPLLQELLADGWQGLRTDLSPLDRAVELAENFSRHLSNLGPDLRREGKTFGELLNRWRTADSPPPGGTTLPSAWSRVQESWMKLAGLAGVEPSAGFDGPDWIATLRSMLTRWKAHLGKAQGWLYWNGVAHRAEALGFLSVTGALRRGSLPPEAVTEALDTVHTRWWVERLVTTEPALLSFFPERHEDLIARFQEADARVQAMSGRVLQSRLGGGVPDPNAFGKDPEWGVLSREIAKKMRHLPLRRLFEKIPNALVRLTPCLMMSPLSVAQYLAPDAPPFDVVIFDEASQIPVWDAIGAIARGHQAMIVGDPEQLPPTSFGERTFEESDDPEEEADQESILDECLAANLPRRSLTWHYRSRHESLIAFSNERYYEGRLITFPSPVTADRAVRYVHVPGGVYERGGARVNREEARQVTAEVVRRLRDPRFAAEKRSLGVVTFNSQQQTLIENLFDAERRQDPELERFFHDDRWHEPVFVKNIENVQGDERDTIIFSVGVGPDAAGRVHTTISSLNRRGGHRRLNVAITRARAEMLVFATLRPEQIDATRTANRGTADFKNFLEYAQRGPVALTQAWAPTGGGTESPFEDAVLRALEKRGWYLHPQVGVSGFRIDFGVVHPDEPGRYLAGVECDGATYHRQATARDRDRLRESILTGMGWRIRRVWSTEWWQDADAACDRLHAKLAADLADDRAQGHATTLAVPPPAAVTVEAEAAPVELPSAPLAPAGPALPTYRTADFAAAGLVPLPGKFYDEDYEPTLRAMVAHVIATEGPVLKEVLVHRLARAHGFARSGPRIHDRILQAVDGRCERTAQGDGGVIWPVGTTGSPSVPFRRAPAGTRPLDEIPDVELVGLAAGFLGRGLTVPQTVAGMVTELGLARLTKGIQARLTAVAEAAHAVAERNMGVPPVSAGG